MIRSARVVPLVLTVALIAACRRQPETTPAPADTAAAAAVDTAAERRAREAAEAAARDSARRQAALDSANRARAEAERMMTEMRNTIAQVVYFDYDASEIRDDQRAALDAKVPILRANAGLRIRITGHTDERGSDEYNMALGQRRAAAAKRYLVSQGIEDARIEIVSLGEERPAAQGSDESAWSQNRRAEFEITAGGDNLQRGS